MMCLIIFMLVTLYIAGIYGQPSYEYNCACTFHPDDSGIFVTDEHPASCLWKFKAHEDEKFRVTFRDFGGKHEDCRKHYVAVRDRHINAKHCGDQDTPYTIETSSNDVTIRSWKSKQTPYFSFEAFLTRDIKSKLEVHETPMTWTEAAAVCKENGGYLAESYPVVSEQLYSLIHSMALTAGDNWITEGHNRNDRGYWIGKSLTPWVMLRGCVRWERNAGSRKSYKMSKYNQMSECAAACSGFAYFLLQKKSCVCVKEEKKTFIFVPYKNCNSLCPGKPSEKCGGWKEFTLYEYYHGDIVQAKKANNCVSRKGEHNQHYQSSCDTETGFSCKLKNGSVVTYNPNVPGRQKALSWHKALDFCTNLQDSLGMSPIPKYQHPYFSESYWTTIRRTVDWNYDTVTQRHPEYSSVATLDNLEDYIEFIRNSSEKHGFVCQNDAVTCGHEEVEDIGNITSPDYPLPYKGRQVCEWHITVNESKVIKLLITDMDVEDSTGCIYDYILVKENNKQVERLCGHLGMKYIFIKNNTATIVFRSDDTVTGKGFIAVWSAVDPSSNRSPTSREYSSLSGGAIVGITIAVAVFLVILLSLAACVAYKKRHTRPDREETSTAHNAIYAISSFNTSSFANEDNRAYQNVSQSRSKYNLKAEPSYANDPKNQNECSTNVYQTVNYKKGDVISDVNIEDGSKANLLLDSDSSTFGSIDSKTHEERIRTHATDVADVVVGGAMAIEQPSTFDISSIDDLGEDCIKVESIEIVSQEDIEGGAATYNMSNDSSTTYTEFVTERKTNSLDTTEEDGYLNEGLDSNARMPQYEDMSEPSEDTQLYIQLDQTLKYTETENRTSNTYLEL